MRFPELLWCLVNSCDSDAISWSEAGVSIIVDYLKFKEEYMNDAGIFKTNNIASFVRQLNLYGFRKCHRLDAYGNKVHEFQHPLFVKGRRDLMVNMKRKPWSKSEKKTFFGQSKENYESMDVIEEFSRDSRKPSRSTLKKSPLQESDAQPDLRIPFGYLQEPSSMEQMKKFWWNHPALEQNIADGLSGSEAVPQKRWTSSSDPVWSSTNVPIWNRNALEGNSMGNYFYGNCNVPCAYPVLQRGEGNAYYLLMAGHPAFQYGGMYAHPDFFRVPLQGMPLKMESNGAGDASSENEQDSMP